MTETSARDVIVVGAGPAGLAAAQALAQQGLGVLLVDEQATAGGQIWRNAAHGASAGSPLAESYAGAEQSLAALRMPGVDHAASACVLDAAELQDADPAGGPGVRVTWLATARGNRGVRETAARAIVVATGAMERPVLFAGATLPGVMGVGALQGIVKQSGMVPTGAGLVLAGQGPLLLLTLAQILDLGGRVDAVLDLAPEGGLVRAASGLLPAVFGDPKTIARGASLLWRARRSGVTWYRGVRALTATGDDGIREVSFEADGTAIRLPCTLLAVHDGVIPNTQLTRLLHLEHDWNEAQQAFAPRCTPDGQSSRPSVWVAGDGAGIAGAAVAQARGTLAGLAVAVALGALPQSRFDALAGPLRRRISRHRPARALIDRLYPPLPVAAFADNAAGDDVIVCRCEAVTLDCVRAAIGDGATGPNRVKTFTRCGMGPCQGRMCGNVLTRIVADTTGSTPDAVGALRIRPPLKPTLISDYLGSDTADGPSG